MLERLSRLRDRLPNGLEWEGRVREGRMQVERAKEQARDGRQKQQRWVVGDEGALGGVTRGLEEQTTGLSMLVRELEEDGKDVGVIERGLKG